MIQQIESMSGFTSTMLSQFKDRAWNALNGFTHTGFNHITRRHKESRVETNYPEYELAQALDIATVFGLLAVAGLASMSDTQELQDEIKKRLADYATRRTTADSHNTSGAPPSNAGQ